MKERTFACKTIGIILASCILLSLLSITPVFATTEDDVFTVENVVLAEEDFEGYNSAADERTEGPLVNGILPDPTDIGPYDDVAATPKEAGFKGDILGQNGWIVDVVENSTNKNATAKIISEPDTDNKVGEFKRVPPIGSSANTNYLIRKNFTGVIDPQADTGAVDKGVFSISFKLSRQTVATRIFQLRIFNQKGAGLEFMNIYAHTGQIASWGNYLFDPVTISNGAFILGEWYGIEILFDFNERNIIVKSYDGDGNLLHSNVCKKSGIPIFIDSGTSHGVPVNYVPFTGILAFGIGQNRNGHATSPVEGATTANNSAFYVDDILVKQEVIKIEDDQKACEYVASQLENSAPTGFSLNDIILPTSIYGTSINWQTSDEGIITNAGVITRHATETKTATLTAQVTRGSEIKTVVWNIKVAPMTLILYEDFEGYDPDNDVREPGPQIYQGPLLPEASPSTNGFPGYYATLGVGNFYGDVAGQGGWVAAAPLDRYGARNSTFKIVNEPGTSNKAGEYKRIAYNANNTGYDNSSDYQVTKEFSNVVTEGILTWGFSFKKTETARSIRLRLLTNGQNPSYEFMTIDTGGTSGITAWGSYLFEGVPGIGQFNEGQWYRIELVFNFYDKTMTVNIYNASGTLQSSNVLKGQNGLPTFIDDTNNTRAGYKPYAFTQIKGIGFHMSNLQGLMPDREGNDNGPAATVGELPDSEHIAQYSGSFLFDDIIAENRIYTEQELIEADLVAAADGLNIPQTTGINLALPTEAAKDVAISWGSSDTDIISTDGVLGEKLGTVTLTATLTKGSMSITRTFDVTVKNYYIGKFNVEDGKIVSIEIEHNKEPMGNERVIVAKYNNDGDVLLDIRVISIGSADGLLVELTSPMAVSDVIKAFIWNEDNLQPFADVTVYGSN